MESQPATIPMPSAEVSARLEDRIESGEFGAGSRLPSERELAQAYSVSRPVIREALRGLAARGLVSVLPGRGSFVRDPQKNDLADPMARLVRKAGVTPRHVVDARANLECAALEAAVDFGGSDELTAVREALEAHRRARGPVERARTDFEFHLAIVRASGNPVLEIMYQAIRPSIEGMMLRSQSDEAVWRAGDPHHEQIYEAMVARQKEEASRLMLSHITLANSLYGDDLDRPLEEVLESRSSLGR